MDQLDQVLSIVVDDEDIRRRERGETYEHTPSTRSTGPCAFARGHSDATALAGDKKGGRPPERRTPPHDSALSEREVDEQ